MFFPLVMKALVLEHPLAQRGVDLGFLAVLQDGVSGERRRKCGLRKAREKKNPGTRSPGGGEAGHGHPRRIALPGSLVGNDAVPHGLLESGQVLPCVFRPAVELPAYEGKLAEKGEKLVEALPGGVAFFDEPGGTSGNLEKRQDLPQVRSECGEAFSAELRGYEVEGLLDFARGSGKPRVPLLYVPEYSFPARTTAHGSVFGGVGGGEPFYLVGAPAGLSTSAQIREKKRVG